MRMLLFTLQEVEFLEVIQHFLPASIPVEAIVALSCFRTHAAILGDNIYKRKIMALPCCFIVEVMGRGHFHHTGAESRINHCIGDNRYLPASQRQPDYFIDKSPVSFVIGMNRNGGIPEHCLWPGRRHGEIMNSVFQRISYVIELTVEVFILHFEVGKSRMAARTPVDKPVVTVDQTLLEESEEDFPNCLRQSFIER